LVIAVVGAPEHAKRALELHMRRLRKRVGRGLAGELKANKATDRQIRRLLCAVSKEDIAIVVVVMDKRYVYRRPNDPEDWYRDAVCRAVCHCVDRWPEMHLVLDKRYTQKSLRKKLDQAIEQATQNRLLKRLSIRQADSRRVLGLQVIDYIAWAVRRHYEREDSDYYEIIKDKIVVQEIVALQ
jgi:hypothetical protein